MNIYRGWEACRLFVMVCLLHRLPHVSGRPQKGAEGRGSDRPHQDSAPSLGTPCRQVPEEELWIRLDSARFHSQMVPSFAPAPPVLEPEGLSHSSPLTHSTSRHRRAHSTQSAVIETPAVGTHRRRTRLERKRNKRMNKQRQKFLKKVRKTKDLKKLEKLVLRDEQWQCEFHEEWKELGPDYFPENVRTGRCGQSECMFGFSECKEKIYKLPVLKRDRLRCNPIPIVGPNTEHEEVWVLGNVSVVVGCECSPITQSPKS